MLDDGWQEAEPLRAIRGKGSWEQEVIPQVSKIQDRALSIAHRASRIMLCLTLILLTAAPAFCFGMELTPLDFLKDQERRHRAQKGEVYLGKVMTLNYPTSAVEPGREYNPLLLELTDVLKTPIRKNYRLVLKGYSDAGETKGPDLRLSALRAERLKSALSQTYGLDGSRISAQGLGNAGPISRNETPEGRSLNRRVEIHVHGDVSEAVRFIESEAGR
jgi:hypothetical protein